MIDIEGRRRIVRSLAFRLGLLCYLSDPLHSLALMYTNLFNAFEDENMSHHARGLAMKFMRRKIPCSVRSFLKIRGWKRRLMSCSLMSEILLEPLVQHSLPIIELYRNNHSLPQSYVLSHHHHSSHGHQLCQC